MESTLSMSSRSLQYYVIAKRWLADMEFFRIEAQFLHLLLERNMLIHLHDKAYLKLLIAANKELKQLQQLMKGDLLSGQITQLELMAEDIIPEDAESLAATQVRLEYFMTDLTNRFRGVKQDVFALVLQMNHLARPVVN
ncbi:MAG: hypothetical protein ACTHMI_02525 [Mucilaginibacter sp.]|uniref:hypothetical protein n=1 Tax=Mucilaginibacter sp. L3T2-6 TaxID=3062491 RepID=UPI0026755531|nr:hypothetical protein [Mucilaginibacter sp. L3T2-6]MDO3643684.1 hypothetical protein [Mucilaginibacter sp. L3T2-6]MDV6216068.1 hypothetical protein [Mucilaginibacter sp. L3T2-6]